MKHDPMILCDFYKVGHPFQYPEGTTLVYSNLTPRNSRMPGVDKMVWFGAQAFIKKYLIDYFNEYFFSRERHEVVDQYAKTIKLSLGTGLPSYSHIESLHKLGYLPLCIKALPEGAQVEMGIPVLTLYNTLPEFYWVTNFIETILCASIWKACTSATIARQFRILLDKWAFRTGFPAEAVPFQGHDFSFRGMDSLEAAQFSGAAHLLSFSGTDTIPAIEFLENYYGASGFIGGSIPATEHSVMCAGGQQDEYETYKRLITQIYPKGFVSIVSDTWDLWNVLTDILPKLKHDIMNRDGRVVIRPDSGDPVEIICGINTDPYLDPSKTFEELGDAGNGLRFYGTRKISKAQYKGVIELLWDTFGGTTTDKGFKLLDSHIGAIYGDSITLDVAERICERLYKKKFASQCVFGIGSMTYQGGQTTPDKQYWVTRDLFGLAMKATYVEIDGKPRNIFKNPVTDSGTKKSAKGLLKVVDVGIINQQNNHFTHSRYELQQEVSWEQEREGALKTIFLNGKIGKEWTLDEVKHNLLK